ncbi:hypothetical protein K8R43_06120 [archaeon]|nr:hypothetical protein [archaeon]
MKAGGMLIILIVLLAYSSALTPIDYCKNLPVKMDTQPGCPQNISLEQAEVYIGEDYFLCGNFYANQELTAYEQNILKNQTVTVSSEGLFELKGTAGEEHKVYNIQITSPQCENIPPIMLEVKNKCDLTPPSVSILPKNTVQNGETFTINISSSNRNLDIMINGLTETIELKMQSGQTWSKQFQSNQCCQTSPCDCTLKVSFTDSHHPICKDDVTQLKLTIKEKTDNPMPKTDNLLVMAAVAIIILGTIAVVAYNRTK